MSTTISDDVAAALFGLTRRSVLALLFGRAGESFYLREIARETGTGTGAVQRELARLSAAGLIRRNRRGHQVYFEANPESPVYDELRSLMTKTAGLADVLRRGLADLSREKKISAAFVYGSVAQGKQRPSSDVDLFVVGTVTLRELMPVLRPIEQRLGREINPSVYTPEEVRRKLDQQSGFLDRVMADPRIMLYGTQDDLVELAGKPLDHASRPQS